MSPEEYAGTESRPPEGMPIPPRPPRPRPEPAVFPPGFWRKVDYLLQCPEAVLESIRRDVDLWSLARLFLVISIVMAAIYGAVMGATNLLQASVMDRTDKFMLIGVTAVKVPVLFLLTLFIVLWPIYISNAFEGSRLSFRRMVVVMLSSTAVMSTMLASMATVALFFSLTSTNYHFMKVLHVAFFIYAGVTGLGWLLRSLQAAAEGHGKPTPPLLFVGWLVLYMFVGTQLAWVLRPFVGSPNEQFQLFRPRHGNFYESVLQSMGKLFEKEEQQPPPPPVQGG